MDIYKNTCLPNKSEQTKKHYVIKALCNLLVFSFVFLFSCEKDKIEIEPEEVPKLTFEKLSHKFSAGKFTQKEILGNVKGKKVGYVIKRIKDILPINAAEVKDKAIIFKKVGAFTATLVLKRASKSDATIKEATFEITKADAVALTFNKLTKKYSSGGSFSAAEIGSNIQGDKTGYVLKEIKDLSTSDFAVINKLKIDFKKEGRFTATLVLAHPSKEDAVIKGAQFEITKANVPITPFEKTYGKVGLDMANAMIRTSDGGYALAGLATKTGSGARGGYVWLVKLDAKGDKQWDKTFGGMKRNYANALIQTKDGGYVVAGGTENKGAGNSDAWLIKTDANGDLEWDKTYGGSGFEEANAIVQTDDEGYAFAGSTNSKGAGDKDVWLVRTDSKGTELWDKVVGVPGRDEATSMIQTKDGGYAVVGSTWNGRSSRIYDVLLIKFNDKGDSQWDKTFGKDSGHDMGAGIVQTDDGGYALSASTSQGAGGRDFWLIKTDEKGVNKWNKTYGGAGYDFNEGLIKTMDGGYALFGKTSSKGAGGDDMWLVKTDASGTEEWDQTYGGADADGLNAVVQNHDGSYFVAGYTESKGAGSYDLWIFHVPKR